ncbi:hypothetical protein LguiA_000755 [Lonicera macranthoides]
MIQNKQICIKKFTKSEQEIIFLLKSFASNFVYSQYFQNNKQSSPNGNRVSSLTTRNLRLMLDIQSFCKTSFYKIDKVI